MKKRIVWLLLALLWTGFIWSNSLQPAEVSGQTSGSVVEIVEPVLTELGIPEKDHSFVVRKAAHLTEFALLGVLWLLCFRRSNWILPCGWALGLCAATAVTDEIIQHFVSGRSAQLRDVGLDILGAFLGTAAAAGFGYAARARKESVPKKE